MKKMRKIAKSQIAPSLNPFIIDDTAQRYLTALEHAEVLKKALLEMCRRAGFTPQDAPKTKMLAGELYEVLASRATRIVVDQRRARALREKMYWKNLQRKSSALLRSRIVFTMAPGAERAIEAMPAWVKLRFHDVVELRPAGTRLTVRKRKVARGLSPRRKAA